MNIVFVQADDWTCIYIDGELVDETHSIGAERLAEILAKRVPDLTVSTRWEDETLMELGRGTATLAEFEAEKERLGNA